MKPHPIPPAIVAALFDVEHIADQLAATFCDYPAKGLMPAETAACLDNLDTVAAALTWKELEQAPAMLNAVARAYRQSFPSDSLGWEDAGRLQTIAALISHWQTLPDNGSATPPPPPPPPDNGTGGGLI
jgi:hypothetical protein